MTDRPAGSGYAYVDRAGVPILLAASNRRAATALTWEALAGCDPDEPVEMGHVSAANDWAVDVAMAARLELHQPRLPRPASDEGTPALPPPRLVPVIRGVGPAHLGSAP